MVNGWPLIAVGGKRELSFDEAAEKAAIKSGTTPQTETSLGLSYNQQNEITTSGYTYDGNGNLKADGTNNYFYDAWNRLAKVQRQQDSTVLATYQYDALSRRIVENSGGTATDLFYSSAWQVLEEQVGGAVQAQYVWSPVYVDALVLRDRTTTGTLSERLYAQQDANWDVTALVNTSGAVVQRFIYDPYGSATVLTPNFGTPGSGDTIVPWVYLRQGGRFEVSTGLYYFRARDLNPVLDRWMENDPRGFGAGDTNFYRDEGDNPANALDPSGNIVIFLHGIRDPGTDWMEHLYYGMYTYWKENGKPIQYGISFRWEGSGKFLLNPENTPSVKNAHPTISSTLDDKDCKFAAEKLQLLVAELRDAMNAAGIKNEPINIVAHSQASMLTLPAMKLGMKVDNVLLLHSPQHKTNGRDDVKAAAANCKTLAYYYDQNDSVVRAVNGYLGGKNGMPAFGEGAWKSLDEKPSNLDSVPVLKYLKSIKNDVFAGIEHHATWLDPHYGFTDFGPQVSTTVDNREKLIKVLDGMTNVIHVFGMTSLYYDKGQKKWLVPDR
jgi:RHS repeat-associated protein